MYCTVPEGWWPGKKWEAWLYRTAGFLVCRTLNRIVYRLKKYDFFLENFLNGKKMKTQIEQTKKIAVKAKGIKIMICKESKLFWELGFNLQAFSSSQKNF